MRHINRLISFVLVSMVVFAFSSLARAETIETVYDTPPDIANCQPGILKASEKQKVLDYVNYIRGLHHLAAVEYDAAADEETAQASLLIVANNSMSHTPSPSAHCFTEAGYTGSSTSNLYWGSPREAGRDPLLNASTYAVRGWLIDDGVPSLGHRRWLLDPFLQKISFGRNDGPPFGQPTDKMAYGAAIKVIYDEKRTLDADTPEFVAYPQGDYPLALLKTDWYWSFSLIADPTNYWNNQNVNFAKAKVTITSATGKSEVLDVRYNTDGAGVPNFLQWRVAPVEVDETYHVEITGVEFLGQTKAYEYDVKITAPFYDQLDDLPVYEIEQNNQVLEVSSDTTFALFAPPPGELPNSYNYTNAAMTVQAAEHSPYVRLFHITGEPGDEMSMYVMNRGNIVVRIRGEKQTISGQTQAASPAIANPQPEMHSLLNAEMDEELARLLRDSLYPVYLATGRDDVIAVRSDMTFFVYTDPQSEFSADYETSNPAMQVMASPLPGTRNLMVFDLIINAQPGDKITLHPGGGTTTLQIVGSINDFTDPVERLKHQLAVPVYMLAKDGETLEVAAETNFALYITPDGSDVSIELPAIENSPGTYLSLTSVPFAPNAFTGSLGTSTNGQAQAKIRVKDGRHFIIQVGGQYKAGYDAGYQAGRESCRIRPEDCGVTLQRLGGYSQQEYEQAQKNAYEKARQDCIKSPADCGIVATKTGEVAPRFTPECQPTDLTISDKTLTLLLPVQSTKSALSTTTNLWLIGLNSKAAETWSGLPPSKIQQIAVDPSGLLIAYISDGTLYVWDGLKARKMVDLKTATESIAWSPDGQWIAFSAYPPADGTFRIMDDAELYAVDLSGEQLIRLTDNEYLDDLNPVWSPAGNELLFTTTAMQNVDHVRRIFITTLDSKAPRPLTGEQLRAVAPVWSPNGEQIAFIVEEPRVVALDGSRIQYDQLYVISKDGSGQRQVTFNEFDANAPTWSPDGKRIAFTAHPRNSTNEVAGEIYVVNVGGACQSQLVDPQPDYLLKPFWSPIDSRLAILATPRVFTSDHPEWVSKLYIVKADGTGLTERLAAKENEVFATPQWSLAFVVE